MRQQDSRKTSKIEEKHLTRLRYLHILLFGLSEVVVLSCHFERKCYFVLVNLLKDVLE